MHSTHAYVLTCHPRVDHTCHAFIKTFYKDSFSHFLVFGSKRKTGQRKSIFS